METKRTLKSHLFRWSKSSLLFLFVAITLVQLPCRAQSQTMKRGRDWMDLKRYDDARSEFMKAIREEPKNAEARYLIARCYYLDNDPIDALKWVQETIGIVPTHPGALSLRGTIQSEAVGYLSTSDARGQVLGLQIIDRLPTSAAIPGVKSLMASPNPGISVASEKLLLKIDAKQVRMVWVSWLSLSDARLKETGAERLWSSERYAEAAPILRKKYEVAFMAAADESAARQAAVKLDELGWAQAVKILATPLRSGPKMPQALIAADMFALRKERLAIPALVAAFWAGLPGKPLYEVCSRPFPQLADALARIGATESVPLLKEALSNYLSGFPGANPYLDGSCVSTYLNSLSLLNGGAWNRFVWQDDGGAQHQTLVADLDIIKNGESSPRSERIAPIDATSPNAAKIRAWLQNLGPANLVFGKGVSLDTVGNYVKIQSATEMRYYGETHDSNGIVRGAYLLFLHATGDPERAWVVTDVQERSCDKCGRMQEWGRISFDGVSPNPP